MSFSDFSRCALGISAAFGILAGCGNVARSQLAPFPLQSNAHSRLDQLSQGLVNTAGALPRAGIVPPHYGANPGQSWMSPDAAKTKDLLYVSNLNSGMVNVYSYPTDKLVGTIKGDYDGPDGMCVD